MGNAEDTIHMVTINILKNRAFIAPVAKFVKRNIQKGLGELNASATMKAFIKTGSANNSRRFFTVSLRQMSTSAMLPSPNTSSHNEAVYCKAERKHKSKKSIPNSSSDKSLDHKHQEEKREEKPEAI